MSMLSVKGEFDDDMKSLPDKPQKSRERNGQQQLI